MLELSFYGLLSRSAEQFVRKFWNEKETVIIKTVINNAYPLATMDWYNKFPFLLDSIMHVRKHLFLISCKSFANKFLRKY